MPDTTIPWTVTAEGFPVEGTDGARLRFLVRYAVLAPSGHNAQPWRFRQVDGWLEVRADRGRRLPVVDPDDRELTISCGAALGTLEIALRRFGFEAATALLPDPGDPDLLARVGIGPAVEADLRDVALFAAIPERRTRRLPFEARPVAWGHVTELHEAARREGADLRIVADGVDRRAVADLVEEAVRLQFDARAFRRELAEWLRPNASERRDGIPGYALGMPDLASRLGPWALRSMDWGAVVGGRERKAVLEAPVVVLLTTDGDGPREWLSAGRALARLLLRARTEGLYAAFHDAPVEVPACRERLREALGLAARPQVLLRLGYGDPVPPTPRRGAAEVIERA